MIDVLCSGIYICTYIWCGEFAELEHIVSYIVFFFWFEFTMPPMMTMMMMTAMEITVLGFV